LERNDWPTKNEREQWEINKALFYLSAQKGFGKLQIESKRERPDYEVKELGSGRLIGVELTSVYVSNRSVPDRHIGPGNKWMPPNNEIRQTYFDRIIKAIMKKVALAKKGYDIYETMVLSLYINEYEDIYNDESDWKKWAKENDDILNNISPFTHIIFWPLINNSSFLIYPS
jgi:hypothetical protein